MRAQMWVSEGTDLEFVLDRRPRDVRDLLKKGKPWTDLFWRWYTQTHRNETEDLHLWFKLVRSHEETGSLQKTLAAVPEAARRMGRWKRLIAVDFFGACHEVRMWMEVERKQARQELERERGTVAWYQRGVSDADVRKRLRTNLGKAVAKARSEEWEQACHGAPGLTGRTVAQMEAVLTAFTRTVKPQFMALYQHYGTRAESGPGTARQYLADAHSRVAGAEAWLREAGQRVRDPESVTRAQGDRTTAEENLIAAWVDYTRACEEMGTALLDASQAVVDWAVEDTVKKIQANFGTVHPEIAWAQLGIRSAVTVLNALLQCFALASVGAPPLAGAALTVSAGLTVALKYIEELTVYKIAQVDAESPAMVRRHLGADYRQSSGAKTVAAVASRSKDIVGDVGTVLTSGLRWASKATDSPAGAAALAVPGVGTLGQFGKIGEQATELLTPGELTHGYDRTALLAMLDRAQDHLNAPGAAEPQVQVHEFDPATGQAKITVNGVYGILENGRFRPADDGRESLEAVLHNWARSTKDINPRLDVDEIDLDGLGPVTSFVIQHDGQAATPATVASAITWHEEEPGRGFKCRAHAMALPCFPAERAAVWEITFFVTYEGKAKFLRDAEPQIQWLGLTARSDPGTKVFVHTRDEVRALAYIQEKDPALDSLRMVRSLRRLPGHFILDGETLRDADGTTVMELALLYQLCDGLEAAQRLLEELEWGQPPDIEQVTLPGQLTTFLLGDWYKPLEYYRRLRAIENEIDRWLTFEGFCERTRSSPLDHVRFLRFVQADDALSTHLERIGRLYAELLEPSECELSDDDRQCLADLKHALA
ncbi:hypothetical protein [Streptomyces sp. NPDC001594]|uniref:hypothetical protein n=1 Tax=Streptomyces sp. NPDC001594 TaxID=3364590 RepID=UPI0036BEF835